MNRSEYLRDSSVEAFIEWLRPYIRGDRAFEHSFKMLKPKPPRDWRCSSLWDAHERYEWNGMDFDVNQAELDCLAECIRRAVKENDRFGFVGAANGILRWGGVMKSNADTLRDLGGAALSTFREASRLLDPSHADTSQLDDVRYMNSGWTKVYSLMLDGFPILRWTRRRGNGLPCAEALHTCTGQRAGHAPLPVGCSKGRAQPQSVAGLASLHDALRYHDLSTEEVGGVQRASGVDPE